MKKLTIITALLFLVCLSACGEEKIDGSSLEKFNQSTSKIHENLKGDKQILFGQAMLEIAQEIGGYMIEASLRGDEQENSADNYIKTFNGKTADDVIKSYLANKSEN